MGLRLAQLSQIPYKYYRKNVTFANVMEIENKVAKSGIYTIDLEEFYSHGPRFEIDIKDHLFMGLILKEKDFRTFVKEHNWEIYKNGYVALVNSGDAIVPTWAYMLLTHKLSGVAKQVVFGTKETMETILLIEKLQTELNPEEYTDTRVVVKGCGKLMLSPAGYVKITEMLTPFVRSLMFGEPCSTVPIYKKTK